MDFDSDIRLDFLAHHNSPEERNDTMFPPDILMYMHKTILNEEEEECRVEAMAREKLPEIFEGNPSEAEDFIYQFVAYFIAHNNEPVLASPVASIALTLSQVKGEEVDQWVDQQLQWLKLQDQQDPKVGSAFVEAFFEQFVPKGRWQSIARSGPILMSTSLTLRKCMFTANNHWKESIRYSNSLQDSQVL